MGPRRGLLAIGFVLMVINKVAGFVLPYSSKFLIDNVVSKNQVWMLRPLVLAVLLATLIQGITSFSLTQLLSKAAQRLIAELREEGREEKTFATGVRRLLDNVMRTLTATSLMSLSASVLLGFVGAATMYVGGRQMVGHALTPGGYISYNLYLVFLVAPILQVVSIGTQITEALAGLERTQEIMRERPEDQDPRRSATLEDIVGTVEFQDVSFSYDGTHEVLHDISFTAQPGTVTALVGSSGSGKSTTIGLISAFYVPTKGAARVDGVDLSTVRLDSFRTRLGVVLQESFWFDGTIRENVAFSRPVATEE